MYGHWEGDTVRGKGGSGYLVTLVERQERLCPSWLYPKSHQRSLLPRGAAPASAITKAPEAQHYPRQRH